MSDLLTEIRARRQKAVEDAKAILGAVSGADTETKRSLLSIAARSLSDSTIAGAWIELALAESDTTLRGDMLSPLLRLDYRQIPDLPRYMELLVWGVSHDESRDSALAALGNLVASHPEVVKRLIQLYQDMRTASAQRAILSALCRFDTLPPPIGAFFLSVIGAVDADMKFHMANRLLRIDAVPADKIALWLEAPEPAALKMRLLGYVMERSLPIEPALIHVLLKESDADCRLAAIRAMAAQNTTSAAGVRALLQAAQKDASPAVRSACLFCFRHSLQITPEVLAVLIETLKAASSREICLLILDLLAPYLSQSAPAREALSGLLKENLHMEVAGALVERLGKLASWDRKILEWLLDSYQNSVDDHVRGIILRALSAWHEPDERLTKIYIEALGAPSPAIKTWGVRGLLMLPLTPAHAPAVASAVTVLLDPGVDRGMRLAMARKIGKIADLTAPTREQLKKIIEQTQDDALKAICQTAIDRASTQAPASSIDFDHWIHRVQVDHDVQGIFPVVYGAYDEFPDPCRRILKSALLDAACANSLYENGVSSKQIFQFLMSRNALDDDIARFCLTWVIEKDESYGNIDLFLSALRTRPSFFPELRQSFWNLFRDQRSVKKCNPVLLRQTLVALYGGDNGADAAFREHFSQQTTVAGAAPYIRFLTDNILWPPAHALLREAIAKPALLDDESKMMLQAALREFGEAEIKVPRRPRLADD